MKRFKYLFMALVMITCLFSSSDTAFASGYSSGKAVIPFYYQSSVQLSYFSISNITDNPITVTVSFYNENGLLVTDDNNSSTGLFGTGWPNQILGYCDQLTDATLTFTLNAHSTGVINANTSSTEHIGYGIIKWEQNGNELHGLVAYGFNVNTTPYTRLPIPINNGMPF